MRTINPKWILLAVLALVAPISASERTGVLLKDTPEIKKTQDTVMKLLNSGNKKHVANHSRRDGLARVMIVSCADSRVPPETVFHLQPGEIFTTRAFGNVADQEILASLEFGAETLGCRVLVVLGHTNCTALKRAIAEHGHPRVEWNSLNQEALYKQLEPAVSEVVQSQKVAKAQTGKELEGDALLDAVVRVNVLSTMHKIREQSPRLWELEQTDVLKIVGAIYHIETGKVEWLK